MWRNGTQDTSLDTERHDCRVPQKSRDRPERGGGNQTDATVRRGNGVTGLDQRNGRNGPNRISRSDHHVDFTEGLVST